MTTNESGQSVVEYALLLAVVVFLVVSIFKSDTFLNWMGPNGSLFQAFKTRIEYSYRYALPTGPQNPSVNPSYSPGQGDTRFFAQKGAYPQQ